MRFMGRDYYYATRYNYEWVEIYNTKERCAFCRKKLKKYDRAVKGYYGVFPSGEISEYYCSKECAKRHRKFDTMLYKVHVEEEQKLNNYIKEENEKNGLSEGR